MLMFADALCDGIVKQNPKKFEKGQASAMPAHGGEGKSVAATP
jgi:hypothetical protein